MVSSISFHPFLSHLPIALFVASLALLYLGWKRKDPRYNHAASFNLSLGAIAAVLADFSGMVSTDVQFRSTAEVEGHQGYSFLFTVIYGFATVYSYTRPFSRTALVYYGVGFLCLLASAGSGYALVFLTKG